MKIQFTFLKTGIVLLLIILCAVSLQVHAQESPKSPKIEVKQMDAMKSVVIKASIPSKEIGKKMEEIYGKLFGYLAKKNTQPAGAPFAVYYEYNPDGNTVFEAGVPIMSSVEETSEIKYKEFPSMKAVSTLYIGPYEKSAPVYEAMMKYAKDNNITLSTIAWEFYLTDPGKEKDPAKNQTLIYLPVK